MRIERERRLFHPAAIWPGEEGSNGTAGHDDALEVLLRSLRALAATDRGLRRIASHGAVVQVGDTANPVSPIWRHALI